MSGTGGDTKKDLTSVLEFQKAILDASENASPAEQLPGGEFLNEAPIEKVDQFENLDAYSASHPDQIAETPSDPFPQSDFSFSSQEPQNAFDSQEAVNPFGEANPEFQAQVLDSSAPDSSFAPAPSEASTELTHASPLPDTELPISTQAPPPLEDPLAHANEAMPLTDDSLPALDEPLVSKASKASASASLYQELPSLVLEKVKDFSETLRTTPPLQSDAAYLFSIFIDGPLSDNEKARLQDIIENEELGLRPADFTIQLESGKVLIPRISEYAAISIVQTLRTTQAEIHCGPADTIYSTMNSRPGHADRISEPAPTASADYAFNPLASSHPAEEIPITAGGKIAGFPHPKVVGILSASGPLLSTEPNKEGTAEYVALLSSLERELRYKAHRKGAQAIIHFKVQTTRMRSPDYTRILVLGTAIREND